MPSSSKQPVLVTGACGHIGQTLCALLRESGTPVIAVDVEKDPDDAIVRCDLRESNEVAQIFRTNSPSAVIHLAAVLPTAYHSDPLAGAAVNLTGSLNLLREAVSHRVKRFVFASSVSVYSLSGRAVRPMTEDDPTVPDEPYGASKRAIELIGEILHRSGAIEFTALRIPRVMGPGIKKTNSPWRAQILEPRSPVECISIPYAADAQLGLLHVEDAAQMLIALTEAEALGSCIYNCPSEIWRAGQIKELIQQARSVRVQLGPDGAYAGAICDGSRFAQEFGFRIRGLRERLAQTPGRRDENELRSPQAEAQLNHEND
jgi:UDP-glucuronate 4-epimerase